MKEVEYIEVRPGVRFEAKNVVCPECEMLDLGTTFESIGGNERGRWRATCTSEHSWDVYPMAEDA